MVASDLVGAALTGAVAAQGGPRSYAVWIPGLALLWLAIAGSCGAYRCELLNTFARSSRPVLVSGVTIFALLPLLSLLVPGVIYDSRTAVSVASTIGAALLGRWVARTTLRARRRSGADTSGLFVVGDAAAVADAVRGMRRSSTALSAVRVGVPDASVDRAADLDLPVVAFGADPDRLHVEPVLSVIRERQVDGVLLAPGPGVSNEVLRRVARTCEWHGVPLFVAPAVFDIARSASLIPVGSLPFLAVTRPGPAAGAAVAKAMLDRVGAALGLLFLAPLLGVLALGVRLDSPGPALFRQTRVGAGGVLFTMVKFRTMRVDAETELERLAHLNETDATLFKIREDPRVTRLGRVLRKTSIDELPQLINVLAGHMSLVGPRPPLPREVATYTVAERRRLLVKPGMTGLWQVSGRANLSWADTVRLDLRYVDAWSLPLDVKILARTLPQVVRRNGAF